MNDIKIQIDKVESVKYMTELEIKKLILDRKITESHGIIFNEILNYKKNRTKF